MVVPAFVATGTAFLGVYYMFRRELIQSFVPPELDPQSAFKDKRAAAFHSIVLLTTLFLLSVAPWIGASLCVVCAISAGSCFLYNAFSWPWNVESSSYAPNALSRLPISPTKIKNSYQSLDSSEPSTPAKGSSPAKNGSDWVVMVDSDKEKLLKGSGEGGEIVRSDSVLPGVEGSSLNINDIPKSNVFGDLSPPSIKKSLMSLPYRIVPFVFGMFVLVEGLYESGWIDAMADILIASIPTGSGPLSVFASAFLLTGVTILLCNLINNQPATILLTRVIIAEKFMNLAPNVRSVGMFAVILGSNLGANFTLIGALAGIMWAKILADKNLRMTYLDFAKVGFVIMPLVTVASAGVLFIEHLEV
jgi:Na+/H+ antiporter NhaD/arsenite permease-like protein